jgi:hypothetical protein
MDELFKVILNDVRTSKNRVNRLLGVGIIFVLLGHFYVVEPYFAYKVQEGEVRQALIDTENNLTKLSNQVDRMKGVRAQAHATLAELRQRINNYPDHLRDTLWEIDRAVGTTTSTQPFQQTSPVRVNGIPLPSQIKTFEAGVRWYVEQWFEQLITDLQDGVVKPILALEHGREAEGGLRLKGLAQEALEKLRTYLGTIDPDFWQSYATGKVPVARDLQQVVEESFGPLEAEVTGLLKKTAQRLQEEKKTVEAMRAELVQTRENQQKLESRIASLESPLGRIPLSLPDLIILFPLLVAVIIVMVVFAFKKSGELCLSLWEPFTHEQGEGKLAAFQHYTDCWFLPPYGNMGQPFVMVAWLTLITIVFVRGSLLVLGEPELFASLTGDPSSFKRTLFTAAYLAGGAAIIGAACSGLLTVRRLSQRVSHPESTN